MRSARIQLILDTLKAIKGAKDFSKAADDVAGSLDHTAVAGKAAGKAIDDAGDEMSDAARAAKSLDKQIEDLTSSLRGMAVAQALTGENFSKQMRDQEAQVRRLTKNRKLFGDIGDEGGAEAAAGFAARFSQRLGPLIASGPGLAIAGTGIGLALAPTAAAALAAGVVGGAGIGGVIGGLIIASKDSRVQSAATALGGTVMSDLNDRAARFVGPMLDGIADVRAGWLKLGPDLDRIFASSRFVDPLVTGLVAGGRKLIGGIADAVDKADPVIGSLAAGFDRIGAAVGDTFSRLSNDADEGASAVSDLTLAISNFITVTGGIIHGTAVLKGYTDQLDVAIDKARGWIENNSAVSKSLGGVGIQLDLTADGFKAGSAEAEAYQRLTTGVGTAADVTKLRLAGMSDAKLRDVDASGKAVDAANAVTDASGRVGGALQIEEDKTKAAAAATEVLAARQAELKAVQDAVSASQLALQGTLDGLGGKTSFATQASTALKQAMDNLYGASIRNTDANETYQASWDSLSGSVAANGRSLSSNTTAGRSNRDALEALLTSSGELYISNIAAGVSIESARKKHEARTEAIRRESVRLGLNKTETQNLINTYGKIPGKKTTDLVLDGVREVVSALKSLYVFQRALAEGRSLASMEQKLRTGSDAGPAKRFGGFLAGGWTGPGAMHQPAGVVHADEFVIKKSSRRKIENRNPGLLEEMNATGQMPGYASGGLVAPIDTSRRWPFPTDMGGTRIPSRAEVASKIPFTFGNWPSSPSAQRGDSGVWRKIVALIRSTGPMSGSFGNAYRAGDPKWHGSGRAVDWMGFNQDRLATFLAARRPLELIHRTRNRDYAYTRGRNMGSFNEGLMNAHRNHVHIAMANGGVLREPVFGYGMRSGNSYSLAERGPERVTPMGGRGGGGGNTYVTVQAGYVVTPQQLEDKIAYTIDRLRAKGRA